MITVLRFIGIVNAAIWLGSAFFLTFAVEPAFTGPKMLGLLTQKYAGAAEQVLLTRYFLVHYVCSFIALVHLFAEWLYVGRPLTRLMLALVLGLLGLGIFGGGQLQPRLEALHVIQHLADRTPQEKQEAARQLRIWNTLSHVLNIVILVGVTLYLWRVVYPAQSTRFFNINKIRG